MLRNFQHPRPASHQKGYSFIYYLHKKFLNSTNQQLYNLHLPTPTNVAPVYADTQQMALSRCNQATSVSKGVYNYSFVRRLFKHYCSMRSIVCPQTLALHQLKQVSVDCIFVDRWNLRTVPITSCSLFSVTQRQPQTRFQPVTGQALNHQAQFVTTAEWFDHE